MRNYKEMEEKVDHNLKALQTLFETQCHSLKGVERVDFSRGSIYLNFGLNKAVESAYIDVDWRTGQFLIRLGSWSALTNDARIRIEARRFDEAFDALKDAVLTFNKINDFFNQL